MNIVKIKGINKFCKTIIFLVTIFVTWIMFSITKNGSFWGDDYFFSLYYYNEGIFSCLIDKNFANQHGGGYIGLFLSKFFSFGLPNLLGLHPSNYVGGAHAIVKGVITIITLIAVSKFSQREYPKSGIKSRASQYSIFSSTTALRTKSKLFLSSIILLVSIIISHPEFHSAIPQFQIPVVSDQR